MGLFNADATAIQGLETFFDRSRLYQLDSPGKALAMRLQGSVITPANLSLYLDSVVGNPGIALEITDALTPTVTTTIYAPTGDRLTTGWVDQGGGAFTFADINDRFNNAAYARNTAALAATSSLSALSYGNATLAATRILQVRIGALVQLGANSANGASVQVSGLMRLNSADYEGPRVTVQKAPSGQTTVPLSASLSSPIFVTPAVYSADPSTGVSWTMAAVNQLLANTANYGWGITVRGTVAAGGFAISAYWLEVVTVTENRHGFYNSITPPRAGWTRYALSSATALAANTWYWVQVSCPNATQQAYARIPIPGSQYSPTTLVATATGEHRVVDEVTLGYPGGTPAPPTKVGTIDRIDRFGFFVGSVNQINGEMLPVLVETAGPVVEAQSQPYVTTDALTIDTTTAATLYGQQITAAASVSYGGVMLPIVWASPQVRPDRPLVVEVRSGGGAISGGGALNATATIDPAKTTHGVPLIAPFDNGPFAAASGTKYHLIVKSTASAPKGWRFPRVDTRSDNIGSGPSVANIEGASQGGQTDAYFASGVANTRYDLPIVLVQGPVAPVGNAVPQQAIAGEKADADVNAPDALPPQIVLSWAATSLTTAFNGYRVYRRRRSVPVRPWVLVGDITVPTGYSPSIVEALHTRFVDYEAGWGVAGAAGELGWDYAFTVRNVNGMESFIGDSIDVANIETASNDSWVVCNQAPWLNSPLRVDTARSFEPDSNQIAYEVAGRDLAVVRTVDRIPKTVLRLGWSQLGYLSDELLRTHRAASMSGRQMALLVCQGDIHFGTLGPPGAASTDKPRLEATSVLTLTGVDSVAADYNLPAEVAFDGTNDYALTNPQAVHNPGTSAFTFFVCARFADIAGAYFLSKGNGTANSGFYLLRSGATTVQAFVRGASSSAGAAYSAGGWFDGNPHVALATYDGATLVLYFDGQVVASTALVAGAVTNALGITAGANNGGASGYANAATRAWGLHVGIAYTPAQAKAASRYLLQMRGYQIPAGITGFWDMADDRAWDGIGTTVNDLAGTQFQSVLNGSPATRGKPFPLSTLNRW